MVRKSTHRRPYCSIVLSGTIAAHLPSSWAASGLFTAAINDTSNTRKLQIIAGGLAALGVFLLLFTVWFWRSSRADHGALGPLEVMGARRWRRAPMNEQINKLAEVRPAGALALAGTDRPPVDLAELVAGHQSSTPDRRGGGFSDLVDGEPQSLVAPVDEPWAGDLEELDEPELDSPLDAHADGAPGPVPKADAEDGTVFEADHSIRPAFDDAAEPAVPGLAGVVEVARETKRDVPEVIAADPDGRVAGRVADGVAGSGVAGSGVADSGVADGVASDVEPAEEVGPVFEPALDSTPPGPTADVASLDQDAPVFSGDGSPEETERIDEADATTSGRVDDGEADDTGVAGEDVGPHGGSAKSVGVSNGSLPAPAPAPALVSTSNAVDAGHPHDAGDALAFSLSGPESDEDDEFDPSKELAFGPVESAEALQHAGPVTDSFKTPRWRRFRR